MATLSISNITTNSFYWRVSGLTAMSQQTLFVLTTTNYGSSYSGQISDSFVLGILYENAIGISNTYYSGDSQYLSFAPGDSFTVYAYRYTNKWYRADYQSVTIPRPKLSTPYYISSSISSNSITINYSSVSNANVYDIQCTNEYTTSPYSPSGTFNNLQPNTQYGFRCRARDRNYNYEVSDWSGYTYLTTSKARPTNWSWSTAERNAFNNHGAVTTLTWDRWNSFVDKIVEFRNYKGLTEYVTVGGTSYHITNAKVSSSNKTLTALKFNIARTAIGNMNSTGITDRVKGDIVYGSYFITLEDKLKGIT